jgi:uncharacterized membrane protein
MKNLLLSAIAMICPCEGGTGKVRLHSLAGIHAVILSLTLAYVEPAYGALKFCNAAPEQISVALAFKTGGQWHVKGWTVVDPATCKVAYPESVRGLTLYYWAHMGKKTKWGGYNEQAKEAVSLCVLVDRNFEYTLNGQRLRDGPKPCSDFGDSADMRNFAMIESADADFLQSIGTGGKPPPEFQQSIQFDLKGNELDRFQTKDYWCESSWNNSCVANRELVIEEGWEYCVHSLQVLEIDHGSATVGFVKPGVVPIHIAGVGSNNFLDRWSGNVRVRLTVGTVPLGQYSPDKCLPRVRWPEICRGLGACEEKQSPCATMAPRDQIKNERCVRELGQLNGR